MEISKTTILGLTALITEVCNKVFHWGIPQAVTAGALTTGFLVLRQFTDKPLTPKWKWINHAVTVLTVLGTIGFYIATPSSADIPVAPPAVESQQLPASPGAETPAGVSVAPVTLIEATEILPAIVPEITSEAQEALP